MAILFIMYVSSCCLKSALLNEFGNNIIPCWWQKQMHIFSFLILDGAGTNLVYKVLNFLLFTKYILINFIYPLNCSVRKALNCIMYFSKIPR